MFFVILIVLGAFVFSLQYTALPRPQVVSNQDLRSLALTTLQTLDVEGELRKTIFSPTNDPSWTELQISLTSSLPPDVVYNLSVYDIVEFPQGSAVHDFVYSISNTQNGLSVDSQAIAYLVASPSTEFIKTPKKVDRTLYILNCSDSNGWWITGYTARSLASDVGNLLSRYFQATVPINSTYQFGLLLSGTSLKGESIEGAVIMNTFGEAVPIPADYCQGHSRQSEGYDSQSGSYAKFAYTVGSRTRQYNWTWVSIVGYPLYYVSNTAIFSSSQAWGIYGTVSVGQPGLQAFLQGLDGQTYLYNSQGLTGSPGVVYFTQSAINFANYYGVYPSYYQTSTRAIDSSILTTYHLSIDNVRGYIFQSLSDGSKTWIAGATYSHKHQGDEIHGSFTAIGLTRTPDVRVSALAILMHYNPELFSSELTFKGSSRLVWLELAKLGGG
jgi:hypothetical protein